MPVYSYGEDSPLKFEISDKLAKNYNEAVEKFLKANRRFSQKFGRPWEPYVDPIDTGWTRRQQKAWNRFAVILSEAKKAQGSFHPNDFMDDLLVRNAAQTASTVGKTMGRVLTLAVRSGSLYGALRGL